MTLATAAWSLFFQPLTTSPSPRNIASKPDLATSAGSSFACCQTVVSSMSARAKHSVSVAPGMRHVTVTPEGLSSARRAYENESMKALVCMRRFAFTGRARNRIEPLVFVRLRLRRGGAGRVLAGVLLVVRRLLLLRPGAWDRLGRLRLLHRIGRRPRWGRPLPAARADPDPYEDSRNDQQSDEQGTDVSHGRGHSPRAGGRAAGRVEPDVRGAVSLLARRLMSLPWARL